MSITDHYCGDYDINHPIAGTTPIRASAALQLADSLVTAVTVTITHSYTVAFLGTSDGQLKKVSVVGYGGSFPWVLWVVVVARTSVGNWRPSTCPRQATFQEDMQVS